jgi:hypothetical protein
MELSMHLGSGDKELMLNSRDETSWKAQKGIGIKHYFGRYKDVLGG